MHMDARVIKVAGFKSEVKLPPRPFDIIEHHMHISHGPCRRRSIGPLPSCLSLRGCVSVSVTVRLEPEAREKPGDIIRRKICNAE